LVERLLPHVNADPADRATAWAEWYATVGAPSVLAFVRVQNDTSAPDDDILQDAIVTAYEEVERGRYEPRAGIPFTAYVKGIARNKIREARRRTCASRPSRDAALPVGSARPIWNALWGSSRNTRALTDRPHTVTAAGARCCSVPRRAGDRRIATALGMTEETVRRTRAAPAQLREMVV
jgi:hypothetical protein